MALWDNLNDANFDIVANSAGQYSIWPSGRRLPHGWAPTGFSGTRSECLTRAGEAHGAAPVCRAGPDSGPALPVAPHAAALRGRRRAIPDCGITSLIRAADIPGERVAATEGGSSLTRDELLATAAGWARALVRAGCGREVPVAIMLPRGLEALTAIIAVLDAGGAYLPLACDMPVDRVEALLRDCGADLVITAEERGESLRAVGRTVLTPRRLRGAPVRSAPDPAPARGDDLAFIFYTSGTTGEPKGVEGTHRQLVNYALWCADAFAHKEHETTFLSASLHFLGSLTTIFTPLSQGWPITVAPEGASTDTLLDLSATVAGGLLKLTPTHIRMMTARGVPARGLARQLMIGSEPLNVTRELATWMRADPRRTVANHYGLTETHGCFCHWLRGDEPAGSRAAIGTPIDNVDAFIVDADGELVGVDEVGELLVGGVSLGRGYRHRPGMTAERWIPHPWGRDGARLLRTGDLARMDADGVVTVLGRADRQVKIRGHRVEPAAVEEALRALPAVREALVLPREQDGQRSLAAFLVTRPGAELAPAAVKRCLEERFPPQWIPSHLATLPEFPVNANGKVDVPALPEPSPMVLPGKASAAVRWSRTHRIVADVFCGVLRIDAIGLEDGFFDLGGDSLTAVEAAARIGRELGRDVRAPTASASTVRDYAARIDALADAPPAPGGQDSAHG